MIGITWGVATARMHFPTGIPCQSTQLLVDTFAGCRVLLTCPLRSAGDREGGSLAMVVAAPIGPRAF